MKGEIIKDLIQYIAGLHTNIQSLQRQMTFIASQVAKLQRDDNNTSLMRQCGLIIAKDLGTISRSYGFSGLSQVKRLVRDYRTKCDEKGETFYLFTDDDRMDTSTTRVWLITQNKRSIFLFYRRRHDTREDIYKKIYYLLFDKTTQTPLEISVGTVGPQSTNHN